MRGCLQPLLVLTENKQSFAGAIKGLGLERSGEENGGEKCVWSMLQLGEKDAVSPWLPKEQHCSLILF